MGSVDAHGHLPRQLDDSIKAFVYSKVGEHSPDDQLRYRLNLAQNSVRDLHTQVKDLQNKCYTLEYRHAKAREEASLNAGALRRRIGEYEVLKGNYEQLLKECELFRNDREVFAEAAEDAEERRAEADRRAAEAEQRAVEAEQRERAAMRFVEDLLRASPRGKAHKSPSAELKERLAVNAAVESSDTWTNAAQNGSQSPTGRSNSSSSKQAGKVENAASGSPTSGQAREARGAKRVLFEACRAPEENNGVLRRRIDNCMLTERRKLLDENFKSSSTQALSAHEKENCNFLETEAAIGIEQAAQSDNAMVKYLAHVAMVAKENLVKAEEEGDFFHAKYCELHRLLMDTLVTFGILPELSQGKMACSEIAKRKGLNI